MRTISRWWNICSRAGSPEGSRRNTYAPPASTVTPPARQGPARGDRGIDRVAGRGGEHEIGHLLELAPVLVAARALVLLCGLRFGAARRRRCSRRDAERISGSRSVSRSARGRIGGKRSCSGRSARDRAGDQGGDALAHLLEVPPATVDARHAGLDQQTTLDELAQSAAWSGLAGLAPGTRRPWR